MIGRVDHETEAEFLSSLATDAFQVLDLEPADYSRCSELVLQYGDLPLGTTDASVVALAERHNVTRVATIDHRHFQVVRPNHLDYFELLP
ncbi:hypothetical protein SAMN05421642_11258 [Rhodococcoides kyotonense]|uniref:PIN domain-containing protein n=2 Tax=Rhodococcoides kyotonense TaxID=398843 RepID=A0A239L700_9NOCA|nr:hypothetical protein SAMN05421642_11258 [Rhodococcus kyotonensis]